MLTTNFKVTKTSTLTIKAKDAEEKDKCEENTYKQENRQTDLAQEPRSRILDMLARKLKFNS